jgi:hypothetical protein
MQLEENYKKFKEERDESEDGLHKRNLSKNRWTAEESKLIKERKFTTPIM